tara:strand:+ start:4171 stop:4668 length:498 start_codon:yes stop_codon:yes gene_type:complete
MNRVLLIWLALLLPTFAEDLRENAFFKALEGTWTGAGEMTDANFETAQLTNRIVASFSSEGDVFTIQGNLVANDNPVEYSWTYTAHELEGLYRGEYVTASSPENVSEFQVSIDQAALTATLEPFPGGTLIRLQKAIRGDIYEVNFEFVSALGQTTLKGFVKFERE